jgi:putative membrane protein
METTMIALLISWVLFAAVFVGLSKLLPGFHVQNFGTALIVAAVYSILHILLFKIFLILAFIPVILTFGLFIFVINAVILWLTHLLIEGFDIDSIAVGLVAAVLLTIANNLIRAALIH